MLPNRVDFRATKIYTEHESQLVIRRRNAWAVTEQVTWTSREQPPAAARQAMDLVMANLDQHYQALQDAQRLADDNRLFDKMLALLDAKTQLEEQSSLILRYLSVEVEGKRARFQLDRGTAEDLIDEERVCRYPSHDPSVPKHAVGGVGVVVAQDDDILTMRYEVESPKLPHTGELVVFTGASRTALNRQRDAVVNVRAEVAVRSELRRLLVEPSLISPPTPSDDLTWFDDRLDEGKRTAVAAALGSRDFFLLEGPPGTGKTSFITELVQQELARNPNARILLVSQTHVAVDNALVRLAEAGVDHLIRLGKSGNTRIADAVQKHLLDNRMPVWMRQIRVRAEQHLIDLASSLSVDIAQAQAAATLLELIGTAEKRDRVQAEIDALASAETALPSARFSSPSIELDDQDSASELAALQDRLDKLAASARELHARAAELLQGTTLSEALSADHRLAAAAARTAFDAIVKGDPRLVRLVDILRVQAEWFLRIESSKDLEGVLLRQARVVAGTCIGFLGHEAVRDLEFDLCILDEASKGLSRNPVIGLPGWWLIMCGCR